VTSNALRYEMNKTLAIEYGRDAGLSALLWRRPIASEVLSQLPDFVTEYIYTEFEHLTHGLFIHGAPGIFQHPSNTRSNQLLDVQRQFWATRRISPIRPNPTIMNVVLTEGRKETLGGHIYWSNKYDLARQ
jgi:hypothetical protein